MDKNHKEENEFSLEEAMTIFCEALDEKFAEMKNKLLNFPQKALITNGGNKPAKS